MNRIFVPFRISSTSTGTEEQRWCPPDSTEKYLLIAATVSPNATLAADGTNYKGVGLEVGGTSVVSAALTSASVPFTAGTPRNFTVSGVGSALEVSQTAPLSAPLTNAGSGGTIDVTVIACLEKMP